MKNTLIQLFERDLTSLKKQLKKFKNHYSIWLTQGEISNSSGHLTLHLCGNFRSFIGNIIGKTNYIRDRHLKFNSPPVSISTLEKLIDITAEEVEKLFLDYPLPTFKKTTQ